MRPPRGFGSTSIQYQDKYLAPITIDKYVDINYFRGVSSAKTLPFETTLMVKDRCLCLHVQRAARALGRRFDEELRPFELTNGLLPADVSTIAPNPLQSARRVPACHGSNNLNGRAQAS